MDPVIAFYSGGPDHRGRSLDAILAWPDERLEEVHDYIQWVFPTEAASAVNRFAPLVTPLTTAEFEARPELRERLRASLDRLLRFYGLIRSVNEAGTVTITLDPDHFAVRSLTWLQPGNHNHLRLTRIMQSLSSLGLNAEAAALQRCLTEEVCPGPGRNRVTRDTYEYWAAALG